MTHEFDTANLCFRLPDRQDFEALADMRADPVVTRYTGGQPASRSESWDRLIRYRGYWGILGYGYWCVKERLTGRFVGTIGFGEARRGIEPSLDGYPEAGWVLASWCHGKGYGGEGVAAALKWLDTRTDHRVARCIIDPENLASMKLARRYGFTSLARTQYLGSAIDVLERQRCGVTICPDHVPVPGAG
ncbi:GNAT family N-acetyltransferase [Asaia bogorensis]|uniref:GNAT family N-acetyltransferase n=1 Tax=Asaia bogorensis TaxID=91915 RepID=UPI000EFB20D2|nr:GNAT family N-acetyltransferase [Asaia bogorensis]